jgi:hypothetical protein
MEEVKQKLRLGKFDHISVPGSNSSHIHAEITEEPNQNYREETSEQIAKSEYKGKQRIFGRIKQKFRNREPEQNTKTRRDNQHELGQFVLGQVEQRLPLREGDQIAPTTQKVGHQYEKVKQSPLSERVVSLWGIGGVG